MTGRRIRGRVEDLSIPFRAVRDRIPEHAQRLI